MRPRRSAASTGKSANIERERLDCPPPAWGKEATISKLFYYAHLTIRAEWANGVFWTPPAKGPIIVPDPANAADLVADHVQYSLGLVARTDARTDPVAYTVNGYAEAYYGDGRQAMLPLNQVRTESANDLLDCVRAWAQEQFGKLAEIESGGD